MKSTGYAGSLISCLHFGLLPQNEKHPPDVERKRSASQETGDESQKKKIKVIDIRHSSSENQDSKIHGTFN